MEVKKGFKMTELGPIPSEWRAVRFEDVLTGFASGATPYRGRPEYYKGSIRWITSGELNYNTISDTVEKITEEAVRNTNLKMLPVGTFLMAITGLEAAGTRGSCGIVGKESTTNQSCMALMPKNGEIITEYLYHFYVKYGDELAFRYCQGTKQQSYTGRIVKILPINLPPTLTEQRAIATALSDTDALIAALDRLIAKKKSIKQGAMQELLTGRRRLEGFEGEWETIKLGDVLKVRHGKSQHEVSDKNGVYPILATGGQIGWANAFIYNRPSVLIGRKGTIDVPRYMDTPFWCVDTLFFTEVSDRAIPKFLFYRFCLINWYNYNEASGVPSLNASTIENIEISLPKDEAEQDEIVSILTDMDTEIAALERQRDKYKTVKAGMMQELLTGKKRLV